MKIKINLLFHHLVDKQYYMVKFIFLSKHFNDLLLKCFSIWDVKTQKRVILIALKSVLKKNDTVAMVCHFYFIQIVKNSFMKLVQKLDLIIYLFYQLSFQLYLRVLKIQEVPSQIQHHSGFPS